MTEVKPKLVNETGQLDDLNIVSHSLLPSPQQVKKELPEPECAAQTVRSARKAIRAILDGVDKRILVIAGPCSVHDLKAGIEYANRLNKLAAEVDDIFYVVMRVYFEKPRTTVGWKGLINDPYLDDSFKIEEGLRIARKLLIDVNQIGLGAATEALDPVVPQYLDDLVSWTAIGARTAESQTHREMSSGLSTPVGFKNGTDGSLMAAINGIKAAAAPHRFLGINQFGQSSVFVTRGNRYGHIVLRGGTAPNYDENSISKCADLLSKNGLSPRILVDCSHSNSNKDPAKQPAVFNDCVSQILRGNSSIVGLMLESNLESGRQELSANMKYGVSITDGCIDWHCTEKLLRESAELLRSAKILESRSLPK